MWSNIWLRPDKKLTNYALHVAVDLAEYTVNPELYE